MYSFSSRVRYSEVDEHGVLSVASLLNYLQDCSLFQTESLGVGIAHVQQVRRRWLLASWGVEISELPHFCQTVEVSTWATGFSGLFAHRNFTLTRAGQTLVRADSRWFMFDDEKGRPVRPPQEEIAPYQADLDQDAPLDMPPALRKLSVEGAGDPKEPLVVTPAHIDTNHHVNNAQYVNMALGVLPRDLHVCRLDVQYCTAARLGDVICPAVHTSADGCTVNLADDAGRSYAIVRVRTDTMGA